MNKSGKLAHVDEKPFEYEVDDMESLIYKNPQILGDHIAFSEQVISSDRKSRSDFLSVDRDGRVWIVELKRDIAGTNVLGQLLRYKKQWRANIDGVKNMWNEFPDKQKELEPDWDNFDPGIMLVASGFEGELLEVAADSNLPIKFVSVTRFEYNDRLYVTVERKEPVSTTAALVKARREYNWQTYIDDGTAREDQVEIAKSLLVGLTRLVEEKGWNLTTKFNKYHISMKHGYRNAFWLEFRHREKVGISVNLYERKNKPEATPTYEWAWDSTWNHWFLDVDNPSFDVGTIQEALMEAYEETVSA